MPDVSILEQKNIPREEIRAKLDELQSYDEVGHLYGVSGRSVRRHIEGHYERRFCWVPIVSIKANPVDPTQETE